MYHKYEIVEVKLSKDGEWLFAIVLEDQKSHALVDVCFQGVIRKDGLVSSNNEKTTIIHMDRIRYYDSTKYTPSKKVVDSRK